MSDPNVYIYSLVYPFFISYHHFSTPHIVLTHIASMRFSVVIVTLATATLAAAAPFSFPLANGFPKLNSTASAEVYKLAGGPPPNSVVPTTLQPAGIQTLQLIAANELFEVAFFTELLSNISNNVPGYDIPDKDYVVRMLTAVVNVSTLSTSYSFT
jgi:hypothetical protein